MPESPTNVYQVIEEWSLPEGDNLLDRIERMVRPSLRDAQLNSSPTAVLFGIQWHLGGEQDTRDLADLAGITSDDHVLDIASYVGGPAVQLATEYGCRVTGIDVNPVVVAASRKIAELANLDHLLDFQVADAAAMPFPDASFSVVWCQASVAHDDAWLLEFDRALMSGGRLAMVIETRPTPDHWSLPAIAERVAAMGYTLLHVDDLTERDMNEWHGLDAKLTNDEPFYLEALGEDWIAAARKKIANDIAKMQAGEWSNGRIVARKNT